MKVIFATTWEFDKEYKRYNKKYRSLESDLKALIEDLKKNPLIGESLGNNFYKVRMKIKSKSKGKSGGFRVITNVETFVYIEDYKIILAYLYDKSEIENVDMNFIKETIKISRGK
jgi:mRNA-degrading endonuclease RelE of RelBE toxin-antitoxin system